MWLQICQLKIKILSYCFCGSGIWEHLYLGLLAWGISQESNLRTLAEVAEFSLGRVSLKDDSWAYGKFQKNWFQDHWLLTGNNASWLYILLYRAAHIREACLLQNEDPRDKENERGKPFCTLNLEVQPINIFFPKSEY